MVVSLSPVTESRGSGTMACSDIRDRLDSDSEVGFQTGQMDVFVNNLRISMSREWMSLIINNSNDGEK